MTGSCFPRRGPEHKSARPFWWGVAAGRSSPLAEAGSGPSSSWEKLAIWLFVIGLVAIPQGLSVIEHKEGMHFVSSAVDSLQGNQNGSWEPDLSRICCFRQNEHTNAL